MHVDVLSSTATKKTSILNSEKKWRDGAVDSPKIEKIPMKSKLPKKIYRVLGTSAVRGDRFVAAYEIRKVSGEVLLQEAGTAVNIFMGNSSIFYSRERELS